MVSCAFVPSLPAEHKASQRKSAAVLEGRAARGPERERGTKSFEGLGALSPWLLGLALGFALRSSSALAVDVENGSNVFSANCAACHAGGNNAVQPDKKLKKEALEQYGMFDVDRIRYQVTNGKNAMPAFGERLGQNDIEDVANYVISQANAGWP